MYRRNSSRVKLGASTHYAQLRTDVSYGGKKDFEGYSYGGDFEFRFTPEVSVRGTIWAGSNLRDVRGGIGQSFNTGTGKEIDSRGGWLELGLRSGPYGFSTGYTMDDPKNGHVASRAATENRAWYVTNQFRLAPPLTLGIDYLLLVDSLQGAEQRNGQSSQPLCYLRLLAVEGISMPLKRNACALALVAVLTSTACTTPSERSAEPLRFSGIPDQNTTELEERFKPFAEHLSQQLGVRLEYVPSRDYQATVEMFKNGDIVLAWFGGLTGVQARAAVPGAQAIAQGDTDPEYYSYFVANRITGLTLTDNFPMDIGKFKFTFGSDSSTSGRLMPEYFIRQHTGESPREFFSNPLGFSGSHDKTIELVESGQYEVGVVNYLVYEQRVNQGTTDPDVARVIWQTPTYVDYHWVAHPRIEQVFGEGFTERVRQALIGITDSNLLSALPRERLIPAADQDYDQLRRVAEQLGMLR